MRVEIILKPIPDENASGVALVVEELALAMLKDPEDLMSVETMIVGVLEEGLRAIKQRRAFNQNRAMMYAEDADKKTRSDTGCLGCQISPDDERIARIRRDELIKCGVCGKFAAAYYDAAGELLSPVTKGEAA